MDDDGPIVAGVDLNGLPIGQGDSEEITGAKRDGREGAEIRGRHDREAKGGGGGGETVGGGGRVASRVIAAHCVRR